MDSIGQRLKVAREKKRVSLSQAALKTRIKVQHLEGMERDDFSKIPAPIYARGFIRTYCNFLGIDPAPLVKDFEEQHGGANRPPAPPITSKIIKTAPGEQPLPTATAKEIAAEFETQVAPQASVSSQKRTAPALNAGTLATAGIVVGLILLVVGIIKFWPVRSPEDHTRHTTIVEMSRPAGQAANAILRDPPEPYVNTSEAGANQP